MGSGGLVDESPKTWSTCAKPFYQLIRMRINDSNNSKAWNLGNEGFHLWGGDDKFGFRPSVRAGRALRQRQRSERGAVLKARLKFMDKAGT